MSEDIFVLDINNQRIVRRTVDLVYVSQYATPTGIRPSLLVTNIHIFYCAEAGGTYAGRIVQLLKSDFSVAGYIDLPLDWAYNSISFAIDGKYLYIGKDLYPNIRKYLLSDLSFIEEITTLYANTSMCTDGTYLYACGSNYLTKFLLSDFSVVTSIYLYSGASVATNDGVYLYLAQTYSYKLTKRLCSDLSEVVTIGSFGFGNLEFIYPTGVTLDSTYIYVTDIGSSIDLDDKIKKYLQSDLSYVSEIGTTGSGDDQFNYPFSVGYNVREFLPSVILSDSKTLENSKVSLCYNNILTATSLTLIGGVEDSSFPLWRLYDGNISRNFKSADSTSVELLITQPTDSIQSIDCLVIPEGHNLNGATITLMVSDDGIWYDYILEPWVQSDGNLIAILWEAIQKKYIKVTISGISPNTKLSELVLGLTYTWELNPFFTLSHANEHNVEPKTTSDGHDRFVVTGKTKRARRYRVLYSKETQKNNMLLFNNAWAGKNPFWLYDVEGNWIFGKLVSPINLIRRGSNTWEFSFDFLEVIS